MLYSNYQNALNDKQKIVFYSEFDTVRKEPLVVCMAALFGGYGADRYMLGQPVFSVLKFLTYGVLGLWAIIGCVLLSGEPMISTVNKQSESLPL